MAAVLLMSARAWYTAMLALVLVFLFGLVVTVALVRPRPHWGEPVCGYANAGDPQWSYCRGDR